MRPLQSNENIKTGGAMRAIILTADRGVRRLDPNQSIPLGLMLDDHGRRALDLIIGALNAATTEPVVLVGGYHIEKIVSSYPDLKVYYNADWSSGGDVRTLREALVELRASSVALISRSDVVYHAEVPRALMKAAGDIVAGVTVEEGSLAAAGNSESLLQAFLQDKQGVRFAGILKLAGPARDAVAQMIADKSLPDTADMSDLIRNLAGQGFAVDLLPVGAGWARLDARLNFSRLLMGTKSQTLDRLRPLISSAIILDQVRFTVREWRQAPDAIKARIAAAFGGRRLVVRSSSLAEDGFQLSQAGRFQSVLNVDASDAGQLAGAIDQVAASFASLGVPIDDHQIFVQPYLDDIAVSGVVFTRDGETDAPYVVINYDDVSGRSDTVTSGTGGMLKTRYVYRSRLDLIDGKLAALAPIISELQDRLVLDALDIEFAIARDGACYIFQVRPITPKLDRQTAVADEDVDAELAASAEHLDELFAPQPPLLGSTTVLSNMSDWNPAEIIGAVPRPLAVSLYRLLVTEEIWAQSRARLGYRAVNATPLMMMISGHPYIDVRASFNSFIPADLPDDVALRLVEHYVMALRANPDLHDKIEFTIAATCLDFDFASVSDRLSRGGVVKTDIDKLRSSLLALTDKIVSGFHERLAEVRSCIADMAERRSRTVAMAADTPAACSRLIGHLLNDCQQSGTLLFADMARCGFIAAAFLQSLTRTGILTPSENEAVMRSIPTIASDISDALGALATGRLEKARFLALYGHLRPGTYDILIPSYSERPDIYFDNTVAPPAHSENGLSLDAIFSQHKAVIDRHIKQLGFSFDVSILAQFIADATAAREWSKFEFAKNLNAVLDLARRWGEMLDLDIEGMSFLPVTSLLDARSIAPASTWRVELKRQIEANRKKYAVARVLHLPSVLRAAGDVYAFDEAENVPNFITSKTVTAPLAVMDNVLKRIDLAGRIVMIENADPGYDWVFGHGIAGLITKYGGVASHMSIRCAEFGLPAAIGCGEQIFRQISRAGVVRLDCSRRLIQAVG